MNECSVTLKKALDPLVDIKKAHQRGLRIIASKMSLTNQTPAKMSFQLYSVDSVFWKLERQQQRQRVDQLGELTATVKGFVCLLSKLILRELPERTNTTQRSHPAADFLLYRKALRKRKKKQGLTSSKTVLWWSMSLITQSLT